MTFAINGESFVGVEFGGLTRLVRDVRVVDAALGDGVKKVSESEMSSRSKLRRS